MKTEVYFAQKGPYRLIAYENSKAQNVFLQIDRYNTAPKIINTTICDKSQYLIDDILKNYNSNTIRLFILTNHYRMPVEFSDESLSAAQAGAKRLQNAVNNVLPFVGKENIGISLDDKSIGEF